MFKEGQHHGNTNTKFNNNNTSKKIENSRALNHNNNNINLNSNNSNFDQTLNYNNKNNNNKPQFSNNTNTNTNYLNSNRNQNNEFNSHLAQQYSQQAHSLHNNNDINFAHNDLNSNAKNLPKNGNINSNGKPKNDLNKNKENKKAINNSNSNSQFKTAFQQREDNKLNSNKKPQQQNHQQQLDAYDPLLDNYNNNNGEFYNLDSYPDFNNAPNQGKPNKNNKPQPNQKGFQIIESNIKPNSNHNQEPKSKSLDKNMNIKTKNNQSSFAKNPTNSYSEQYYSSFPDGVKPIYKLPPYYNGISPRMYPFGAMPPQFPPFGYPGYPPVYPPVYPYHSPAGILPHNFWMRPQVYDNKDPSLHELLYYDNFRNKDISYYNKNIERRIRAMDGYYNPFARYTLQDYKKLKAEYGNGKSGKDFDAETKTEKTERANKRKEVGNLFMKKNGPITTKKVGNDQQQQQQHQPNQNGMHHSNPNLNRQNGVRSDPELPYINNSNPQLRNGNNPSQNPNNFHNYTRQQNNNNNFSPNSNKSNQSNQSNNQRKMNNHNNNNNNNIGFGSQTNSLNNDDYQPMNSNDSLQNPNHGFNNHYNMNNMNNGYNNMGYNNDIEDFDQQIKYIYPPENKLYKNPKYNFNDKQQDNATKDSRTRALEYAKASKEALAYRY